MYIANSDLRNIKLHFILNLAFIYYKISDGKTDILIALYIIVYFYQILSKNFFTIKIAILYISVMNKSDL